MHTITNLTITVIIILHAIAYHTILMLKSMLSANNSLQCITGQSGAKSYYAVWRIIGKPYVCGTETNAMCGEEPYVWRIIGKCVWYRDLSVVQNPMCGA